MALGNKVPVNLDKIKNDNVFTEEYIKDKETHLRKFGSPEAAGKRLQDKLTNILNRPGLYYKEGMTVKDISKDKEGRRNID